MPPALPMTDKANFPLSDEAYLVLDILERAHYEAWIVGGFVRDALLGRACSDIDIATNAPWNAVKEIFELEGFRTHETGVKHGTITVLVRDSAFEVTTFRCDGRYSDGRHPDQVSFVSTIEEDLARRDFTINALAYHPSKGLLDAFGGIDDLRLGTIRTVGDPSKRFEEDSLRILRACRFSSQLGFSIERETMQAALKHKHLLSLLPAERVRHELEELLKGNWVHDALMDTVDILTMVLPELTAMKGFAQRTPYHIYDVLEHTAWAVQHSPATPLARWAALFHDMGKPASFFLSEDSVGHFYGHARISVMLAKGIMGRLRFSSARQNDILSLVKHHDDVIEPSSKAVKRALSRLGGNPELFEALCDLKRADALSQAPHCAPRADAAIELKNILAKILEADDAFSLKNLAIDGRDVLGLGVKPGPLVGHLLNEALEAVIDERVSNAREDLLDFVSKRLANPF